MEVDREEYSKYSAYKTVDMEYPYVLFRNPIDEISILIDGLPEGDLPIILEIDDVYHKVKGVKKSLLTLSDILRITNVCIGTESGEHLVKNIEDVLECDINWT